MVTCAGCPYGTFGQRTGIQRSSAGSTIRHLSLWQRQTHSQCERRRPRSGTPPPRMLRTLRRGGLLVEEAAGLVRVDRDAGGHGRGEGDLPQVAALGGGWLEPDHLVERGRVVLEQRPLAEGGLADDEVQVAVPVDP